MKAPKSLADLKAASYNPRTITDKELKTLGSSIQALGDLSGIVFNVHSQRLVSGHQRVKSIKGKKTKIVRQAQKKDALGTVAIGYVEVAQDGATIKIPYREVDWPDKQMEMLANVNANAAGGQFDQVKLGAVLAQLEKSSFSI